MDAVTSEEGVAAEGVVGEEVVVVPLLWMVAVEVSHHSAAFLQLQDLKLQN